MIRAIRYTVLGYLCGSVLFARVFGSLLGKKDITTYSADRNPGTANAFMYGGIWCGILTLCGDLLKGFFPVYLYLRGGESWLNGWGLALVIAAPVIGHLFPVFYDFYGGKGIAVTFGCLMGLFPEIRPLFILAAAFIFFSLIIRITPHYDRTIWTYRCVAVCMIFFVRNIYVVTGFLIISLFVNIRLHFSCEEREKCQVRLLWTH